jgi:hypothetical protein
LVSLSDSTCMHGVEVMWEHGEKVTIYDSRMPSSDNGFSWTSKPLQFELCSLWYFVMKAWPDWDTHPQPQVINGPRVAICGKLYSVLSGTLGLDQERVGVSLRGLNLRSRLWDWWWPSAGQQESLLRKERVTGARREESWGTDNPRALGSLLSVFPRNQLLLALGSTY